MADPPTEHSSSESLVVPHHSDRRHRAWGLIEHLLAHQLIYVCDYCDPEMKYDEEMLAELVDFLIRHLVQPGRWNQKKLSRKLIPKAARNSQHLAVFEEMSSWVFATEGVLSHIYQPLLSQRAAEAGQDTTQGVDNVIAVQGHRAPVSQRSALFRLPTELFDMVLEYLPRQDVNDLRLVCSATRDRAFYIWSKRFFRTRQFMIDGYSLQTLLDISKHPELSAVLTHLVIGVDEINTKDTLSCLKETYAKDPIRVPKVFQYWRDAAATQQGLLDTGKAIELLSQAMSNLPNLKAVSVSGSMHFPHGPAYPHLLHYPDLGMRSYGSSAYQMQDRYLSGGTSPTSKGFVERIFNCVLTSLVRSSPKNVKALRTNLDSNDFLPHLNDEAFNQSPFTPLFTTDVAALANLTELHLDVNLASEWVRRITSLRNHVHSFDPCNSNLRQLLCAASNLESLSLSFYGGDFREAHCDFTAWLCEPADSPGDTVVSWPFLSRLVLKGLFISPVQLRALFRKFHTLKSAALRQVFLRRCFRDHPPVALDSNDDLVNHWASFLRASHAALANLKSLELDQLAVMRYREDPNDAAGFKDDEDLGLIVWAPEPPRAGAELPPASITVTDFRRHALERLADQAWFFARWVAVRTTFERVPTPVEEDSEMGSDAGHLWLD